MTQVPRLVSNEISSASDWTARMVQPMKAGKERDSDMASPGQKIRK